MELCNRDKFTDFFVDIFYDEIKSWDEESQCQAESLGYMDKGGYLRDVATEYAARTCKDFSEYCHKMDTSMNGNFANIRWDYGLVLDDNWMGRWTFDFDNSEVEDRSHKSIRDAGLGFDELVKLVEEVDGEPDELIKDWWDFLLDWYVYAFGTYNICYDFATMVAEEMSYAEKHPEEFE